jgi:hypothetical protein
VEELAVKTTLLFVQVSWEALGTAVVVNAAGTVSFFVTTVVAMAVQPLTGLVTVRV